MLFNKLNTPDRTKTQAAYAARYSPRADLTVESESLIVWSRRIMLYKHQVEQYLTEDMDFLRYGVKVGKPSLWRIHWKHNSIPTQIEWERKSRDYILEIELRVVKEAGQIALLSF